jgi:hypothetical protein
LVVLRDVTTELPKKKMVPAKCMFFPNRKRVISILASVVLQRGGTYRIARSMGTNLHRGG